MENPTDGNDPQNDSASESASKEARREGVEQQLANTSPTESKTASPADEQPVDPAEVTDEVPDSPKGVGESTTRRGENMVDHDGKEAGRQDTGTEGPTDRPTGASDARDATAVDPQES